MSNENESNKSIVTSYRLKEDTKEKLKQQLDQLGLTQEKYFDKVVSLMELENVKKNNIFAVNAEEIQELTKRLCNIFINVCEQGNSFLSGKDAELEELKNKYKDMLLNKDNKITEQKQELQDVYDKLDVLQKANDNNRLESANIRLKHEKQLEQLENNLNDKTLIVEEYKQKNDMLLSNLAEYKEYKEQYGIIGKQLAQLKIDNETIVLEKNNLENKNIKLQDKINNDSEMILFFRTEIENKNKSIEGYKADYKELEDKKDNEIVSIKIENKETLEKELKGLENKKNNEFENIKIDYSKSLKEQENMLKGKYESEIEELKIKLADK